jgi:hypothetical protein
VNDVKDEIQATLRQIVIKRDGGCFLRKYPMAGRCGGWRKDGQLILQFEHLNSRAHAISFADERLGVCICRNHHIFWKPKEPDLYSRLSRDFIGPARSLLLDRVQADRRAYRMHLSDWKKALASLKAELQRLSEAHQVPQIDTSFL